MQLCHCSRTQCYTPHGFYVDASPRRWRARRTADVGLVPLGDDLAMDSKTKSRCTVKRATPDTSRLTKE